MLHFRDDEIFQSVHYGLNKVPGDTGSNAAVFVHKMKHFSYYNPDDFIPALIMQINSEVCIIHRLQQ